MNPLEVLDDVLGNTIKVKILRYLAIGFEDTGRGLARIVHVSQPAVLKPLRDLMEQGIVEREIVGKSHNYKLNKDNILVKNGLLPLFRLEREIFERLGDSMQRTLPRGVDTAIFFGSIARGKATSASDWDILLLCKDQATAEKIQKKLPELTIEWAMRFSSALDVHVMVTAKFRQKYHAGDLFAKNVFSDYAASRSPNPLFGKSLSLLLSKGNE